MLPSDPVARKGIPLYSGVYRYFAAALKGVARCSVAGSKQHHGSDELCHDRSKSGDELDAMFRHLEESEIGDGLDSDGVLHIDKFAWRALAHAQKYHEMRGAPLAPAARNTFPLRISEAEALALQGAVAAGLIEPYQINTITPATAQSGTPVSQFDEE